MGIVKAIPNCITSMNLLFGSVGVVLACGGRFEAALVCMLAAAVCDFLDGFAARLLGAYSDLGKELDSLADLISFGLLPAIMLHKFCAALTAFEPLWYSWIPLLIAAFSALRLAKFNLDDSQGTYFKGLATPANALLCASLCCFAMTAPGSLFFRIASSPAFIPVLSLVMCALLVCPVRMFSLKFHKDDCKALKTKRILFLALSLGLAVLTLVSGLHWSFVILSVMTLYICLNLAYALVRA